MNGRRVVVGAWLAMIGLATVRQLSQGGGLPSPSPYVRSGVAFTMLYGLAGFAPQLAAVFAVGLDLSALLTPYVKGQAQSGPIFQLAQLLDSMAGGIATNSAQPGQQGGTIAA